MDHYNKAKTLGTKLTQKILEEHSYEIDDIIRAQVNAIADFSSGDYGIPNVRKRVANLSDDDFKIVREFFVNHFFNNLFEFDEALFNKNAENVLWEALQAVDESHKNQEQNEPEQDEIED